MQKRRYVGTYLRLIVYSHADILSLCSNIFGNVKISVRSTVSV